MFDTHCHLNFKRFKKNVGEVISRAHERGVLNMVIPGTDVKTSKRAIELADQYPGIYAAVGIHPHHVYKLLKRDDITAESEVSAIEQMLRSPKAVAVGEVGMDRHVYEETVYEEYAVSTEFIEIQKNLLEMQIDLAIKYNKSLILHNREAKQDLLQLLREKWNPHLEHRAVFHCCEPHAELLEFAQEHNMFIGVDGDVTYDKNKQEFIQKVPLHMLVIETDSPYILPEPLLSKKQYPNEPKNVVYVAEMIAKLKLTSLESVVAETSQNGKILFGLG